MALEELRAQQRRAEARPSPADGGPGDPGLVAVDLGTGTGAIALSLACEFRVDRCLRGLGDGPLR